MTSQQSRTAISFPSDLAEKIVWTHPLFDASCPAADPLAGDGSASLSQFTFEFPEGILQEAQAATSYALSFAAQIESTKTYDAAPKQGSNSLAEPIISLHYPRQGCHDVIDAMVKLLAHEHGADVVVLDSLEIALGRSGVFGEAILQISDVPYRNGRKGEDNTQTTAIQEVFDHIVNIQPSAPAGDVDAVSRPRIVYMRDFGAMLPSAKLFFPYLVEALRRRRMAKSRDCVPHHDAFVQRTILVLGFAESSTADTRATSYWDAFNEGMQGTDRNFSSLMPRGIDSFYDYMHSREKPQRSTPTSLDNRRVFLKSGGLPRLPILTETFFLRSLAKAADIDTDRIEVEFSTALKPIADSGLASASDVAIFPKSQDCEELMSMESHLELKRRRLIREAWVQTCLVQKGGFLKKSCPDSADRMMSTEEEINLNKLSKQTQTHLLAIFDRIATLAIGISSSHRSEPDNQVAVEVTDQAISDACKILSANWAARSEWLNNTRNARRISEDTVDKEEKQDVKKDDDDARKKEGENTDDNGATQEMQNKANEEQTDDEDEEGDVDSHPKTSKLDDLIRRAKSSSDWHSDEANLLSCIVNPEQIATSFDNICLPEETIDSVRTVVSLPLLYPAAFQSGVLGRETMSGVLLYGPPGTGKTLLCRAIAREGGAQMLQVKPSDILKMWVGESEKSIQNIFRLAYQIAPCIIFIDEIDSLFKARGGDDRRWERNMAMDGLRSAQKNKDAGILVVGATNRPYDLDDAVLRRLPTRLMIELPTEKERLEILKVHLNGETLAQDVNLAHVASNTLMYSGSDLKNLCISAAMESVKHAVGGFSWKHKQAEGSADDKAPTNEHSQTRIITQDHFMKAMRTVSASSANGSHTELHQWHEKFGAKAHNNDRHRSVPQAMVRAEWAGQADTRFMGYDEPQRYTWMKNGGR